MMKIIASNIYSAGSQNYLILLWVLRCASTLGVLMLLFKPDFVPRNGEPFKFWELVYVIVMLICSIPVVLPIAILFL